MFKFFKKKKQVLNKPDDVLTPESSIEQMDLEDVLNGIWVAQERDTKGKRKSFTFLNAEISKKTIRKLKRKGYDVELFTSNGSPGFKVHCTSSQCHS